jgi:hypothetical protein
LRILAIGYNDVHESCDLSIEEYNKLCGNEDLQMGHNPAFKVWVEREFNTKVPITGDEVFKKQREIFNDWLTKTTVEYALAHLDEYKFFKYIGQDLRQTDIFGMILPQKFRKIGKTLVNVRNVYGIRAVMDENYVIRYLILGGFDPKMGMFSFGSLPAELEYSSPREVIETRLGKPTKTGVKNKCPFVLYEIKSKFGLRTIQILFNPDVTKQEIWQVIIA